jgi:drug/metabolite transporter (DMT)-like permease
MKPGITSKAEGLIAINIAAVIFGSAALYGKLDVSPVWIVALRAAFAALALAGLGAFRGELRWPQRSHIPTLIGTGAILAIHWVSFFMSVQWAGVAIATLTFAAFPLFTILLESALHKKSPGKTGLVAGLAILVAVGLLVDPNHPSHLKIWGTVAGIISALTFTVFGIASKKLGQTLSPLRISLYQNAVVALLLVPFLPLTGPMPSSLQDWGYLLLLGILTTAFMHQLYFYALRRLSASTCSGFVALEPVYAILFAALLFREPVTLMVGISGSLILASSFLLLHRETTA